MFISLLIIIFFLLIVRLVYKATSRRREEVLMKSSEKQSLKDQKALERKALREEKALERKTLREEKALRKRISKQNVSKWEWLRKKVVYVKRNPSIIPLIFMVISCLVFNLNLEDYSRTTLALLMDTMGLTLFAISLFSYLSIVTYLSAYPKRQKPSYIKIILSVIMIAGSIALELYYHHLIVLKTEIGPSIIQITADKMYILAAKKYVVIHCVILSITLLLMLTLPIYSKWIRKINTSIKLEESKSRTRYRIGKYS